MATPIVTDPPRGAPAAPPPPRPGAPPPGRLGTAWRTFRARLRRDPARPPRVWLRRQWPLVLALYALAAGIFVGDAWIYTCGFDGCPTVGEIQAFRPSEGGRILDREGTAVGRLRLVRRVNVPLEDVPLHVRQAFVSTEDRRFYDHRGVDFRGAVRATLVNVRAGGVREGFSTITMQVARNTFVVERQGERSMARKLIELRLSRLLEQALTKDQILALYLNVIYLGNGTYGVEAASRDLFGVPVSRLSIAQGAVLAALPKGPSAYTPRRSPRRARARRDLVLDLMAREGYLSAAAAARAQRTPLVVAEREWRPDARTESWALDAVRSFVDSLRDANGIESFDLRVSTTLDTRAQQAAERAVARRVSALEGELGRGGIEGAMVALDPRTGDVRAIVGGREYERGSFNRVFRAHRQPGSAFKPFVYAAALAAGMSPASRVDDEPITLELDGREWTPRNFDDEYLGETTLRRALTKSANAATVRVSQSVGTRRVVETARRFGIRSPLGTSPSLALGAYEVTPLELVTAYAPFANGGVRVAPRLVTRVEGPDGSVLWEAPPPQPQTVMDPRDAFLLTSMLRSVVDEGTGRAVRDWGVRDAVAGKTGTTNGGTDVWFVGYTPTVVAGFWFGYDTPRPMGEASGGRLAAPAWAEFYANGWRERNATWRAPAGLVSRRIDASNGMLANEYCPWTRDEWFRTGDEPTRACDWHTEPVYEPDWPDDSTAAAAPPPPPVEEAVKQAGKRAKRWFERIFGGGRP